jgi:Protein of unknown function (DUF4235)
MSWEPIRSVSDLGSQPDRHQQKNDHDPGRDNYDLKHFFFAGQLITYLALTAHRLSHGPRGSSPAMKLIFAPIGILAGLLAGLVAKKGFERLWAIFDETDPPEPDQRDAAYPKLIAALVVEGAIFRLTKGVVDHAIRSGFARMTGTWPGEQKVE